MGLLNGETLVCHTGVLHAAMKKGKKRVHRLVTLPSYQGIGIGMKFINFIADLYDRMGFKFNLITTTPALRFSLERSDQWRLRRSGYVQKAGNADKLEENFGLGHLNKSFSCNRITYSFDYIKKYAFIEKTEETSDAETQTPIQLTLF